MTHKAVGMKPKHRAIVLVIRESDGMIKTDMPDGTTRYLPRNEALRVMAERFAAAEGIPIEQALEAFHVGK